ncbi:MAG: hypothetical protein ABIH48_00230 [Candidatus Falkowbacteria bacterium]
MMTNSNKKPDDKELPCVVHEPPDKKTFSFTLTPEQRQVLSNMWDSEEKCKKELDKLELCGSFA